MSSLAKTPSPARPVLRRKNPGGAPKGNRNAFKTGGHTAEVRDIFRRIAAFKRRVKDTLCAVETELPRRG